jgi:hypothetical protein
LTRTPIARQRVGKQVTAKTDATICKSAKALY